MWGPRLLENAGIHTPEERASHLRFIEDYVIPDVGPRPASPDVLNVVSHFGSSTSEASVNLNDKAKPCVRFTFELHGPLGNSAAATAPPTQGHRYKQVLGIADAVQGDLPWFKELAAEFFSSRGQEVAAVRAMMPPSLARVPLYYIALDLNGGQRPLSMSSTASIPGFAAPLKAIGDFLALCQGPFAIQIVGIDRAGPQAGARVKLYTRTGSNAWGNIRHRVTLGGRRSDDTTLKGLHILG
ncbi:hypothetical protein DL769_007227 [Monosporascus sp. CRB-8-3]|nr:hypothetical protein DL769_007227 [Monosporascus sp. CRB-8-3]